MAKCLTAAAQDTGTMVKSARKGGSVRQNYRDYHALGSAG